jgi:AcrR family transcriptional regulator
MTGSIIATHSMTRRQNRDSTRTRLINAARRLIAQKGLGATSVEAIAEKAGYSRGAFYSNFESKDELFLELPRLDHTAILQEIRVVTERPVQQDSIFARDIPVRIYRNSEQFMCWTETHLRSIRNAPFQPEFNSMILEQRREIAGYIECCFRRAGTALPIAPTHMALGQLSLMQGVILSMHAYPTEMPPRVAETVLRNFVVAILQCPCDIGLLAN